MSVAEHRREGTTPWSFTGKGVSRCACIFSMTTPLTTHPGMLSDFAPTPTMLTQAMGHTGVEAHTSMKENAHLLPPGAASPSSFMHKKINLVDIPGHFRLRSLILKPVLLLARLGSPSCST